MTTLTADQQHYVDGWSWGAFFGTVIWALGNKLWFWALLSIIPVINIFSWFYLSWKGRRLSWSKGGWSSFEVFKKRQKIIGWLILVLILLLTLLIVLAAVTGGLSGSFQVELTPGYTY